MHLYLEDLHDENFKTRQIQAEEWGTDRRGKEGGPCGDSHPSYTAISRRKTVATKQHKDQTGSAQRETIPEATAHCMPGETEN